MMTRFAAAWPVRLGAGLILALLLGDVLSPASAHAGCGDHLRASRVGVPQGEPTPFPAPVAPCTGPTCSRSSDHPPLTPATVKVALPDLAVRPLEPTGAAPPGHSGWLRRDHSFAAVRSATSIFHPPR